MLTSQPAYLLEVHSQRLPRSLERYSFRARTMRHRPSNTAVGVVNLPLRPAMECRHVIILSANASRKPVWRGMKFRNEKTGDATPEHGITVEDAF